MLSVDNEENNEAHFQAVLACVFIACKEGQGLQNILTLDAITMHYAPTCTLSVNGMAVLPEAEAAEPIEDLQTLSMMTKLPEYCYATDS